MATLVGVFNIGNDPVLRVTKDDQKVVDLNLAYRYGRKGVDGKYPSQWINTQFWGDRAEKLLPFLSKGSKIFCVLGDVRIEDFTRKDGSAGSSLKAKIMEIELLGNRDDSKDPKSYQYTDGHEKSKVNAYQPQYQDDDGIPL